MIICQHLRPVGIPCRRGASHSEGENMTTFQEFDSFEDMQTAMREAEQAANARIMPAQERLRDDTENTRYWFRPYEDFLIFGEAYSHAQARQSEIDAGASVDEADWTAESTVESRTRGYLYGKAFSVVEPDGEYGSTHVTEVVPITKELFDMARAYEWREDVDDYMRVALVGVTQAMLAEAAQVNA